MLTNREILAAIMAKFSTHAQDQKCTYNEASHVVIRLALSMGFTEDEIKLLQSELDPSIEKVIRNCFKTEDGIRHA